MEACGNYVGLGSWNALSVLKTVCQRTPSQIMAGDYDIFYAFRESTEGGGLSRWVC